MNVTAQRIRLITILLSCLAWMVFVAMSSAQPVPPTPKKSTPAQQREMMRRVTKSKPVAHKGAHALDSQRRAAKAASPLVAPTLWLFWWIAPDAGLEWDRNPETNVIGYRAYRGSRSRFYEAVADIGNQIMVRIPLWPDVTNYVAVTAHDSNGLESDFSEEVWITSIRCGISRSAPSPSTPAGVFVIQSRTAWNLPWTDYATVTNQGSMALTNTSSQFFRVGVRP